MRMPSETIHRELPCHFSFFTIFVVVFFTILIIVFFTIFIIVFHPIFITVFVSSTLVSSLSAHPPSSSPSDSLLYIHNTLSQRLFLVDIGATVSVFLHQSTSSAADCLRAVSGQSFPSRGQRTLPLSFASTTSLTHRFGWNFTLVAVDRPILGPDFSGITS